MPLPGIPDVEPSIEVSTRDKNGQPLKRFVQSYYRELPYGWDVLTENLVDPCKAFHSACWTRSRAHLLQRQIM